MSGLTDAMLSEYKRGYSEGVNFALKIIEYESKKNKEKAVVLNDIWRKIYENYGVLENV